MQINNTIPIFLSLNNSMEGMTLEKLKHYYGEFPDIFEEYFNYHCQKTDERLLQSLEKYPSKLNDIEIISRILPRLIEDMHQLMLRTINVELNMNYYLLVGGFGSNAFVERSNKRNIYFCAEKLSSHEDHLKVIVAHELSHTTHYAMDRHQQMDWSKVNWFNGLNTLYVEGCATYLSKKAVPGLDDSVYFSFDDTGKPWIDFYEKHKESVKKRFLEDCITSWDMQKEKEWFRLSGGNYFGFNRLGYLLGLDFVTDLCSERGMEDALTYWIKEDVNLAIMNWLKK